MYIIKLKILDNFFMKLLQYHTFFIFFNNSMQPYTNHYYCLFRIGICSNGNIFSKRQIKW